jgi:hypothetical protein
MVKPRASSFQPPARSRTPFASFPAAGPLHHAPAQTVANAAFAMSIGVESSSAINRDFSSTPGSTLRA